MQSSEKNLKIVEKIIDLLSQNKLTTEEAYGVLEFTKRRIPYASKVEKDESLVRD